MSAFKLKYSRYGASSILVEWPSVVDDNVLDDVISYKKSLQNNNIKEIVDIINTYNSILINYNNTIDDINSKFLILKSIYNSKVTISKSTFKLWKIPVCYDDEFAIDLTDLSNEKKLTKPEIIQCHSNEIYTVFFIGFLPGFLYLGGLDSRLHLERKSTPNLSIKKGSVAIGGRQTGIYPQDSPGGWHIIGNSPINFFNSKREQPCFAEAGDKLQFMSISKKEYYDILELVEAGVYQIESEVVDG